MDEITLGGWNPSVDTLPNMFQGALQFGTLNVPNAANTLETVPSNALQSMTPVSDRGGESWSGFWQDLTKGVIGYAVTRDAARNGISMPTPQMAAPQPYARPNQDGINPLLLVLLVGGAVLVAKS